MKRLIIGFLISFSAFSQAPNPNGVRTPGILTYPSVGGVGINTVTPKAMLDVSTTQSGVLIPRVTTLQRDAITVGSDQNSLLVFNTTTSQYEFYDHPTTSWKPVSSGELSQLERVEIDGGGHYWRLLGNTDTLGGNGSVNLSPEGMVQGVYSFSQGQSNATQDYAVSMGTSTVEGVYSLGIGENNAVTAPNASAIGKDLSVGGVNGGSNVRGEGNSTISGWSDISGMNNRGFSNSSFSSSSGRDNELRAAYVIISGRGNIGRSDGESIFGLYATDFTPEGGLSRALAIGIGADSDNRKDAISAFNDGSVYFPELTESLIDADTTGRIATTKEWVLANAGTGGVESITTENGIETDNTDPLNPVLRLSGEANIPFSSADIELGWGESGIYVNNTVNGKSTNMNGGSLVLSEGSGKTAYINNTNATADRIHTLPDSAGVITNGVIFNGTTYTPNTEGKVDIGSGIESITSGSNISVNNTTPQNPVINLSEEVTLNYPDYDDVYNIFDFSGVRTGNPNTGEVIQLGVGGTLNFQNNLGGYVVKQDNVVGSLEGQLPNTSGTFTNGVIFNGTTYDTGINGKVDLGNLTPVTITSGSESYASISGQALTFSPVNLSGTNVTSTLPTTRGGTGLTAIGTSLQYLRTNTAGTALEYATPIWLPLAGGTMTGTISSQTITPSANNTYTLGTTALRYSSLWSENIRASAFMPANNGNSVNIANTGSTQFTRFFNSGNLRVGGNTNTDPTERLYVEGAGNFTGTVSAATPTAAAHLTRKDYVDALVVTTAASTYTIPVTNKTVIIRFTGTTSTFTLPTVANASGMTVKVYNRGSGNITVNSNAGANDIDVSGTLQTTYSIMPTSNETFIGDSVKINVD